MRPRPGVLPASPQQQEEPRTPRLTLHTPSYPAPTPNTQPPALSLPPDLGAAPWVGGWMDVGKQGWAGVLQPAPSSLGLRLSPERPAVSSQRLSRREASFPGPAQARRTKLGSGGAVRLAPFSRTCGWAGLSEHQPRRCLFSSALDPSPASLYRQPGKVGRATRPGVRGRAPGSRPESPSRQHHCSEIAVTTAKRKLSEWARSRCFGSRARQSDPRKSQLPRKRLLIAASATQGNETPLIFEKAIIFLLNRELSS